MKIVLFLIGANCPGKGFMEKVTIGKTDLLNLLETIVEQ